MLKAVGSKGNLVRVDGSCLELGENEALEDEVSEETSELQSKS